MNEVDLIVQMTKDEEMEESEIRDIARRACIYVRELKRQGTRDRDQGLLGIIWAQIEQDRLREERRERKEAEEDG